MFAAQPVVILWAVLAIGVIAAVRLAVIGLGNPLGHLPGPWYTRFTHYVLKLNTMTGRRMYYVHSLHERYGPVVRISPYQVAVADPAGFVAIHKIGSGFLKSPWYEDFNGTSGFGIGFFAMQDPKRHGARRKLFARAFSAASLRQNCGFVVREKVAKAVGRIKAEATRGSSDVLHWWLLMASDVVGQLCFGESFELLETGKSNEYINALHMAGLGSFLSYELPWLYAISRYIPLESVQKLLTAGDTIQAYGTRAVEYLHKHRDNKANIFANALAERDAGGESALLTERDIQIEAANLMLAGADTTTSTLTYLVWAVLKKPGLQARLEAEVTAVDESDVFDDAALEKLPLLNAVVEETLRLYGGVPANLPRVVPPKGANLGGFDIPGGTEVETQAYTLHRNPDVYQDPLEFDEERWMDPASVTPQQKSSFCPFGAGTRICIGMHLARMQIRMAAALLFRECSSLRLASSTTDAVMEMENFFIITPVGHRCEVTLTKEQA
ncbi:putative sterigmatocystin biosynthesis P450 monooxygenase STCB-like protein 9 [Colletotrichum chlorophyti]|uniref:Putative sterigmatocystin biosynthesis P450 monooxygenase STCB-like protein 9 n=1 Tax=Colletotrichum chlorophyti TaxID=708187 RepID=A0A1Q8RHE4_9PEZI|nr:putative sterigmatocystin biosynthesis P450 monooxygenase STCB-like protein 9 [Colletotrichum chlorophyti]